MKYLLDTNILLWSLNGDKRLKESIQRIIKNPANIIFISVVSAWEISIKRKIGKLHLKRNIMTYFKQSDFEILNINLDHILMLDNLPLYHRDPFDRLLIAQAKTENLILITSDSKFKKYDVKLLV